MENDALLFDDAEKQNRMLQMEEKLKEQQSEIHRLKSIIDELPGSIYWKNKTGVYLGQNAFAKERMKNTHLYQGSITGKTDHDIFSEEEANSYRLNDLEVMAKGVTSSKEEIVKLPSGETLTQLSIKRPLRDEEGNIVGVIGNTVDITYSKKIEKELREAKEKAERANQFKTEIIRHMEHDIRTPFGGIWILSKMLMEQEEDAHKKECLSDISAAAKELLDYCNSMLTFIKTENISSPILNEHFDLKDLI
jgi:two-component system aerobic respiration control sensor histidine kinase ArcB